MTPCAPTHSAVRMIAPRLCGQYVLHGAVFLGGCQRDDALVRRAAAEKVELDAVSLLDGYLLFARLGENAHHSAGFFAARHQDLVDRSAAADRLAHGVSACDHVGLGFVGFVFHIHPSQMGDSFYTSFYYTIQERRFIFLWRIKINFCCGKKPRAQRRRSRSCAE